MLDFCQVLFRVFMDRDEAEVNIQPSILTEEASSLKNLLYDKDYTAENFTFVGTKRAIPSRQDRPILLG